MNRNENGLIITFNFAGIVVSYVMLALSLWLTDIPLATKGYWGIGVLLLTISLVNFVKYKFDQRISEDRISRLEEARNERLLEDYVADRAA